MKKNIFTVIILIALSYWAIRPILHTGFFPMHDDTQVGRVIVMGRALRLGQFPVRWVSDLGYGYGYPIFNFYGPLPYYFGGVLYALGFSGLTATKAMFIFGIIGAGISMYWATRKLFGNTGGLVASLFYLYAPYHAVQIYVRGAVGEFWFLIFLPLIIIGIIELSDSSQRKRSMLITGVGLAGAILSHTILGYVTASLFFVGILIWLLLSRIWSRVSSKKAMNYVFALFIGLGLSSFFWLPAIAEMRFTSVKDQIGSTANFRDHFVCLSQLWNSPWGYGGSAAGCIDGLSFKLGKLTILLSVIAMFLWLFRKNSIHHRSSLLLIVSFFVLAVSIFFMLQVSEPLWNIIPLFAYIQYPWRFLTYAIAGGAILIGSLCIYIHNRWIMWFIAGALIVTVLVFQQKMFAPQYIYNKSDDVFESDAYIRFDVSKISDEYLPKDIIRPRNQQEALHDTIRGSDTSRMKIETDTDTALRFSIISDTSQTVEVLRTYFPGWRYRVNGTYIQPQIAHGIPSLPIPEGYSVVEIDFVNTPVRVVGNIVSVITIAVLITIYGKKAKKTIA